MLSSFGRAAPSADRGNASDLSVATTAFVPPSLVGSGAGSVLRPDAGIGDRDVLTTALAEAAVAGSPASASPGPAARIQNDFQASLPYHTVAESSVISDWRLHYWNDLGKGVALSRGLRPHDLHNGTANTPGVCVLSLKNIPNVPGIGSGQFGPLAEKQFIIDSVTKQLLEMGVTLTEPHHHGQHVPEKSSRAEGSTTDARSSGHEASPIRSHNAVGRKAGGEASPGSHHHHHPEKYRKNLAAVIARDRYQKYVVAKPKKGHRLHTPQLPSGAEADMARDVYGSS